MRMLTFYINRAGKNLPRARIQVLERAKKILAGIIASQKEHSQKEHSQKEVKTAAKKSVKKAAKKSAEPAARKPEDS
jgi:NADH dehydrogenase FAD-containing subunit